MINLADNIEAFEEIFLKYLINQDDDYIITDECGKEVNKVSLLNIIQPSYFVLGSHENMVKIIKEHHKIHGILMNEHEFNKMIDVKDYDIDEAHIKNVIGVSLHNYSRDMIYLYLKTFIRTKVLNSQIQRVATKLKMEKPNPTNIDSVIDYVRNAFGSEMEIDLTSSSSGLDIYNPTSHIQLTAMKKSTGFEYLDIVLGGGWEPKTFVVFQGRPKVGKSLVLSNLAVRATRCGHNVGVFTVELSDKKYVKRLGSNLFSIPYKQYDSYKDDDSAKKVIPYIEKFKLENPNAGILDIKEFPTGSASVMDIENYFLNVQKKKGIHFDVIFVDYINLLRPSDNDTNLYSKIKKICEDLRKIAQRNMWCIVSATQVKVTSFTTDDLGLDSTAESSGLVATVDSLFGIMGDPSEPSLKIKNIANRDEGYMNSHAVYKKIHMYYRLTEDMGDYMYLGFDHMKAYNNQVDVNSVEATGMDYDANGNLVMVKIPPRTSPTQPLNLDITPNATRPVCRPDVPVVDKALLPLADVYNMPAVSLNRINVDVFNSNVSVQDVQPQCGVKPEHQVITDVVVQPDVISHQYIQPSNVVQPDIVSFNQGIQVHDIKPEPPVVREDLQQQVYVTPVQQYQPQQHVQVIKRYGMPDEIINVPTQTYQGVPEVKPQYQQTQANVTAPVNKSSMCVDAPQYNHRLPEGTVKYDPNATVDVRPQFLHALASKWNMRLGYMSVEFEGKRYWRIENDSVKSLVLMDETGIIRPLDYKIISHLTEPLMHDKVLGVNTM